MWAGWSTLVVATAASLLLEGPYGAGLGLSAAWKPSVIDDVLKTHFGHVLVVRLLLLAIAFPLLRHLFHTVDDTTGIVTFLAGHIPATGAVITAGFEFDVPVRFDTDRLEIDIQGVRHGAIPSIPIVEIRL